MKFQKHIPLSAILFIYIFFYAHLCIGQTEFSNEFPIKWKSKIGITTYRTNILEEDGFIYIGSNGLNANSKNDNQDGVFKIKAKNGKIVNSYQSQFLGDNDVTAIALKDGKLYFGTDNYYFYCFDEKTGQELWKFRTPYDVESAPSIADLDNDGKDEVVFCVQQNGVYCLNTEDGSEKWKLDSLSSHAGNVAP
jgi:outer membrane protein assembly factor BamB